MQALPATRLAALTTAAVLLLLAPAAQAQSDGGSTTLEVTITNLTPGQIISPPLVVTHDANFQLFALGAPASPGLAALAEDAEPPPLIDEIDDDPSVFDIQVGGDVILPGATMTIEIEATSQFRYVSLAGMLVTTNDTFFAARGIRASTGGGATVLSPGYDAGSEENNEDCAFIPGPPCGNAGVGTGSSEGFVHINSGIHGIASLAPAEFDWRNPVAFVSVQRAN